jgi:histidinol-phosphate aminotransferase
MDLTQWARPNILGLKPYSSARDEYSGEAMVFLDANENPWNQPWNRYPDPLQRVLKNRVAEIKDVDPSSIFLGNGSDEPIDLLIRIFCEPGVHHIVQIEPTYGMYAVAAGVNNTGVTGVPLGEGYELDSAAVLKAVNDQTRIIFLCSPNNPTGNALDGREIEKVITGFKGPVVVDEAYVDFSSKGSLLSRLGEFPNLVILQTFSKAWGMAGLRLGMAFARQEIIALMNRIKYPYNLSSLTQKTALELLADSGKTREWVKNLLEQREWLARELKKIGCIETVFPSDANFLLVRVKGARAIYDSLTARGIVVRDRSRIVLCRESLRITVGTPEENRLLIDYLNKCPITNIQ